MCIVDMGTVKSRTPVPQTHGRGKTLPLCLQMIDQYAKEQTNKQTRKTLRTATSSSQVFTDCWPTETCRGQERMVKIPAIPTPTLALYTVNTLEF